MVNVVYQGNKIFVDEYGPIIVHEPGQLTYGEVMRFIRKWYKLSPEQIATLYGAVALGSPVTGRHVLRMEQTDSFFPKDPNRRWILAQLLNVPAVLTGLVMEEPPDEQKKLFAGRSSKSIDTEEYYKTLQNYWIHGYPEGIEYTLKDVKRRISQLYPNVLFSESKQQPLMVRLLCGYKILLACIAHEQQCYTVAAQYLTETMTLSAEKKCNDLYAIALARRQILFNSSGDFDASLQDFQIAQQLRYPLAPQIQAQFFATGSEAAAHIARNQRDLSTALSSLDNAEKLLQPITTEKFQFFVMFDQERYLLDRVRTLLAAPTKNLRRPQSAEDYLTQAMKQSRINGKSVSAGRLAEYDRFQAKIYCDQGYYPVAATTAERALKTLKGIQSKQTDKIAAILKEIKQHDPHGKEVMSLELELMKVQRPYLFE